MVIRWYLSIEVQNNLTNKTLPFPSLTTITMYNNHENSKRRRKLSDLTNQFPPPPLPPNSFTPSSQLHHHHRQEQQQYFERPGQGWQEKKDHLVVASPPPTPKRSKVTPSVVSIPRFVLARPTGIGVLAQTLVDISSKFNS